jgi:hypothetical protein
MSGVRVTDLGEVPTALGPARRIYIQRVDGAPMGFGELFAAFERAYPDRYGVQLFPPRIYLLDHANKYHLHVFDAAPAGLDLFGDRP